MQARAFGIGILALLLLAGDAAPLEARIVDIRTVPANQRLKSICHFIKDLDGQMTAQHLDPNNFHSAIIIHALACAALKSDKNSN
jgi:hypothetical protein